MNFRSEKIKLMTKHSRALLCIDPTKARIWHALDVLKRTFRRMTKFKLYRNNIFSPHHRKVNAQLPHTAPFFCHRNVHRNFGALVTALKMAQLRNTASHHDHPKDVFVFLARFRGAWFGFRPRPLGIL